MCFLRWGWNNPKQEPAFVLGSHNPQTGICFVFVLSNRCGACLVFKDAFYLKCLMPKQEPDCFGIVETHSFAVVLLHFAIAFAMVPH